MTSQLSPQNGSERPRIEEAFGRIHATFVANLPGYTGRVEPPDESRDPDIFVSDATGAEIPLATTITVDHMTHRIIRRDK